MSELLRASGVVRLTVAFAVLSSFVVQLDGAEDSPTTQAAKVLEATGVGGGLVVHVGCGDGSLTAALRASNAYLVHGLDTDAANTEKARKHIQSLGVYGPVSVDIWDGKRLPYANGLVNLVVAEHAVPAAELTRVLCPNGVAYIRNGGQWTKTVKPRPEDIDEWTHHLHDAGGNAVARDRVVGPPRHLQWTAGPVWARSHGWTPSVSAMISANGRLFTICDETLTCVDGTVPNKWALIARDAFSGVLLWRHPIAEWGSAAFSGTSDVGQGVTTGRFTMPPHVGKRLVAVGDTVYVTLGPTAPVTSLDAATGKVRRVYNDTANADEVLLDGGRLIVAINPSKTPRPPVVAKGETPGPAPGKQVCGVDEKTGRLLWRRGLFAGIRSSRGQDPFGRLELAAGDGKAFVLTPDAIECLAADSGKTDWRIERPALPKDAVRKLGFAGMFEFLLPVMVYHDGVVLLAQPEPNTHHTYHTMPGTLYAFDARDGRQMWKHAYGGWGHCTQPDVFVIDDVVWTHVNAETEFGSVWGNGYRAKNPATVDYRIQALALKTGELRRELPTKDIFNVGHHHRCYRNRTTERFVMSSRRGVEFVNLATGENQQHHWVRSGCLLGDLPCNGLLYVAPHPCGCYIEAKITGFNALAPARAEAAEDMPAAARFMEGPAYGAIGNRQTALRSGSGQAIADPHDWPTYRHDSPRSGATEAVVGTNLTVAWTAKLGTRPSALTIAGGKAFVAGVDTHTVHALGADDGKPDWIHMAGARVDSPPTIHDGLVLFGSTDGRVTCLRASDGAMVWRFRAAPRDYRVVAFGQLESPWPVPGSVLVQDGKCWFAAGRCSYLDGGIRLYALDPATGKILSQKTIAHGDPETGKMKPVPDGFKLDGLLNDIPGSDGDGVFIRQMAVSAADGRTRPHLYTTGGFLDSSWFNRTYWKYGRAQTSGVMVLGDGVAFGAEVYASRSRETVFKPGSKAYRLQCLSLKPPTVKPDPKAKRAGQQGPKPVWEQRVGIRMTAMVRAGDVVFVAGSPDIVDPDDPHGAWEGRKGGVLAAFSASDGKKLAEHRLPSPPVWDGMAAVPDRLYIALLSGEILCLKASQP